MSLSLPIDAIRAAARKVGLQSDVATCADADLLCRLNQASYDLPVIDVIPSNLPVWMQNSLTWVSDKLSNRYFNVTPAAAAVIIPVTTVVGGVAIYKAGSALAARYNHVEGLDKVFAAATNEARIKFINENIEKGNMAYLIALSQLSKEVIEAHFVTVVDQNTDFKGAPMSAQILQMNADESKSFVAAMAKQNRLAFVAKTHDARMKAHGDAQKAKAALEVKTAPKVEVAPVAPSKSYIARAAGAATTAYGYMPSLSLARFRSAAPVVATSTPVAEEKKDNTAKPN